VLLTCGFFVKPTVYAQRRGLAHRGQRR
jgi:hypothetical protein